MRPARHVFIDIDLGPLPVDEINATLGLELEPGSVILSAGAQKHIVFRHPHDYAAYLAHVGTVIKDPSYAGDDLKNNGKIELIRRVPGADGLLVAMVVSPDEQGRYHVASFYTLTQSRIDKRREKGTVLNVKRK